ncbi:GNAT family N-acetyltransferase [Microvirga sp. W0021]|uniref:GNAT family N-acetyltransferase n=1 Tax=Hohaiivirga grylli TaxID=3133970 RepID=A0ABV0BFJ5_9HYPH
MTYKIKSLNQIDEPTAKELLDIWERSVRATHDFLTEQDIRSIHPLVVEGLHHVTLLGCYENNSLRAFAGISADKLEMLFVDPDYLGRGLGRALVTYMKANHGVRYVDVNEQNASALRFYERMGFIIFDRSELDGQGNPFPILHMKLQ